MVIFSTQVTTRCTGVICSIGLNGRTLAIGKGKLMGDTGRIGYKGISTAKLSDHNSDTTTTSTTTTTTTTTTSTGTTKTGTTSTVEEGYSGNKIFIVTNPSGNRGPYASLKHKTAKGNSISLLDHNHRRPETIANYAHEMRHFRPSTKEWANSVYSYSGHYVKLLSLLQNTASAIIKSYLNSFGRGIEAAAGIGGSRKVHIRKTRGSIANFILGKPEFKHTSDCVYITCYVFANRDTIAKDLIASIGSLHGYGKSVPLDNKLKVNYSTVGRSDIEGYLICNEAIRRAVLDSTYIKSTLANHFDAKVDSLSTATKDDSKIDYLINAYVSKAFHKEVLCIIYRQLAEANALKFQKRYALPLVTELSALYNKPVKLSFVKIRYPYMDSSIFSQALAIKIGNRANSLLHVLANSLEMLKLPTVDRHAIYNDIYNRGLITQSPRIDSLVLQPYNKRYNGTKGYYSSIKDVLKGRSDVLDTLLASTLDTYPSTVAGVFDTLKDKHVSGIRIEVAGRLTKRYTASRSLFKLRYKGNIRDSDSSTKGLPSTVLRGIARPNVQYSFVNSKVRTGAFGVKGWIASR